MPCFHNARWQQFGVHPAHRHNLAPFLDALMHLRSYGKLPAVDLQATLPKKDPTKYQLSPIPPRKTRNTWSAWHAMQAPHTVKEFVHRALWSCLLTGDRIQTWRPQDLLCLLDQHRETNQHSVANCLFQPEAFGIIAQCFQAPLLARLHSHRSATTDHIAPTLVLAIAARLAGMDSAYHWKLRCVAKFQGKQPECCSRKE